MSDVLPSGADPQSVGKRTAQGSGIMVLARLITRVIDLLTMLTLTRILVPADFGVVAIAMTLIGVAEAALDLPINQALLRLPHVTRSHYDTAFTVSLLRGLALFVLFTLAAHPFATFYGDPRLFWLVIVLGWAPIFRAMSSPGLVEYQKKLSFWRDFVLEISGKLIAFVAGASVGVLTGSYWALAVCTLVGPIATTAYSYYLVPYRPRWSLDQFRVFYGFLGWASAAAVTGSINWQFDRLLLGKFQPLAQLGLFTTASDLSGIPFTALFAPMIRPLLAAFSHLQGDEARLADSYQRASSAIVSIGLPALLGVSLTADPLVFLVLGPRWMGAAHFVHWLSLTWIPALFALPIVPLLMALGRTRTFFLRNAVEIAIKIPVAIVGVFTIGAMGVILARFVSELLADVMCLMIVRRLLGLSIKQQLAVCWRAALAAAAMIMVVEPLLGMLPPATDLSHALLALAAAAAAGGVVYGTVLMSAWALNGRPNGLERMIWSTAATGAARLWPTRQSSLSQ